MNSSRRLRTVLRRTALHSSFPHSLSSSNATLELTLLDVGAGSASISASFAKLVAANGGRITAIDFNPLVLERRPRQLQTKYGLSKEEADSISFHIADPHSLPFPNNTFDITYSHQVLAHNKGQPEILREMLRVTKPGGVVAAREGDTETERFWPALPGLLKCHREQVGKFQLHSRC